MHKWAQLKGITVVGTGDFSHPGWYEELIEKLEPAEQGLYKLKKEYVNSIDYEINNLSDKEVRFILTGEISCIYKKNDKVRKVHNLIFAPDFDAVKKIQNELNKIGNIKSDGRPILGLDAKILLEIVLNSSEKSFLVPAHIWTPWFSALGSKSGFDTIGECYDDLTDEIFAIETGLSSDPPMNWACSFLDKFTVISNSDAHSPENLGREANIFNTDLSYDAIKNALRKNNDEFLGTLEFFPQEGKYHLDGHRKCNICWNPVESVKNNFICTVCGKKVTLGVMYRVAELADRNIKNEVTDRNQFKYIIPLKEIIGEIVGTKKTSKKVGERYFALLNKFGSEFDILLNHTYETLKEEDELLAKGIMRMRERKVHVSEGYDGEYGVVKVFKQDENKESLSKDLFLIENKDDLSKNDLTRYSYNIDIEEFRRLKSDIKEDTIFNKITTDSIIELNDSQQKAVNHITGPSLIIAGPGTGKTKTLTYKIIELINQKINSENILALTFSNQAAKEIKLRVLELVKDNNVIDNLMISTFHAFGLSIIQENLELTGRKNNYSIITFREKELILKNILKIKQENIKKYLNDISEIKQKLKDINNDQIDLELKNIIDNYNRILRKNNFFDFDDLLNLPIKIFKENLDILKKYQEKYKWINIDEYQDINYAQYSIIKLLASEANANITVIGDPNQAIYGFRGADAAFINAFIKDYPQAKVFHLEKSYRCTDNILNASSHVVSGIKREELYLRGIEKGTKIIIKEFNTGKSEAEFIARQIEKMIGGLRFFSMDSGITDGNKEESYSLSDFAVLVRINQQIEAIEKAFKDHSIPYQKVGELPFYRSQPFVLLVDLIKIIVNPDNILLSNITDKLKINQSKLHDLVNFLKENKLSDLIKNLIQNYFKEIKDDYKNEMDALFEITKDFEDNPSGFINSLSTSQSIDLYKKDAEAVKLMTMHSAKGLEFDTVFIAGCSDKILPFSLFDNYDVNIEEEQRLLYVAMTRAKEFLYMTYSKSLNLFGRNFQTERSAFLERIEKELIDFQAYKLDKKKEKGDKDQLSLF